MLILTRKLGESVIIENNIIVTVSDIKNSQIKLGVNDSEVVTIKLQESVSIADGIKISVEKIDKSQVKLVIDAPANMNVKRE